MPLSVSGSVLYYNENISVLLKLFSLSPGKMLIVPRIDEKEKVATFIERKKISQFKNTCTWFFFREERRGVINLHYEFTLFNRKHHLKTSFIKVLFDSEPKIFEKIKVWKRNFFFLYHWIWCFDFWIQLYIFANAFYKN